MIKFEAIEKEVEKNKIDIIHKLVGFSTTDVILFWSSQKELHQIQEAQWAPVLKWLSEYFNQKVCKTDSLTPPPENEECRKVFEDILYKMSIKELTAFYLAAVRMKSPLLALALINRKISAPEAFELAYLEELYQNKIWGEDAEAVEKQKAVQTELAEVERYLTA